LLEDLVTVDLGKVLWHARQQGREEPRELRPFPGGGQKFVRVLGEERGILARAILEYERHTAGRSDARDGGRREREGLRLGHAGQLLAQLSYDHVGGQPLLGPRIPIVERDEVERIVGRRDQTQQAEARHARVVLDARLRLEDRVELVVDRRG